MTAQPTGTPPQIGGHRRRILFLLPFAPDLDARDGGTRAITALVTSMATRHEVHVVHLDPDNRAPAHRAPGNPVDVQGIPVRVPHNGRIRRYARLLALREPDWAASARSAAMGAALVAKLRSNRFDVVHVEFHVMAQYLPLIARHAPDALTIVTEHEPGICAGRSRRGSSSWARRALVALTRVGWARYEKRYLSLAHAVVTFNGDDARALRDLLGKNGPTVEVIALRIPMDSADPAFAVNETNDLLFFGNFAHPPNIEAALWLARVLVPALTERHPGLSLAIVGANPPPALRALANRNVRIVGEVDRISP